MNNTHAQYALEKSTQHSVAQFCISTSVGAPASVYIVFVYVLCIIMLTCVCLCTCTQCVHVHVHIPSVLTSRINTFACITFGMHLCSYGPSLYAKEM